MGVLVVRLDVEVVRVETIGVVVCRRIGSDVLQLLAWECLLCFVLLIHALSNEQLHAMLFDHR